MPPRAATGKAFRERAGAATMPGRASQHPGGPVMDIGLFCLLNQRDKSQAARRIIAETVEQVRLADQLDLSIAWFAEHHFSNYCLCPSPLMMIGHCAAVTERIRLGAGVLVLPLYAPARLLGEIGFADCLSAGRLVLGIGSGYQAYEFERFGGDLAESKARTLEVLDMIERGLGAETFAHDGRYYRLPPTPFAVKPLQRPHPDIWVAGAAPELIGRAARSDYPVIVTQRLSGIDVLLSTREWCAKAWREAGVDPARMRFAVLSAAHVCDSRAEALDFADNIRFQARLATGLRNREEILENGMLREQPLADEPTPDEVAGNLIIGDAEDCAARVAEMVRRVRPYHLALYFGIGRIAQSKVLRSMERFADEVLPAVEKEVGPLAQVGEPRPLSA